MAREAQSSKRAPFHQDVILGFQKMYGLSPGFSAPCPRADGTVARNLPPIGAPRFWLPLHETWQETREYHDAEEEVVRHRCPEGKELCSAKAVLYSSRAWDPLVPLCRRCALQKMEAELHEMNADYKT